MNRVQDIQLITALITDLKPNTEERAAILRAFEAKQIASRDSADENDDAMRLARELATPMLWSDIQRKDWKVFVAVRDVATQADEWSLPWQVVEGALPYEPVATLCLPSTISDDRARPVTFYDLWRAFRSYDELVAVNMHFRCFGEAFWRKCGKKLFPRTTIVVGTTGWLWKKEITRFVNKRIELGDGVERYAREKIRERYGWYSPNDLFRK